ncbi:MAG TPA: AAA family ATPase [Actinomycetales bacterium]|nr:AAA family ATPase [Actinomycetales bacterium]
MAARGWRCWVVLRDRRIERAAIDRLLDAVRAGESRALVLRGDPGVGKSALLDYLLGRAAGCRVAHGAGVQSEMELAFAGLHQLCAPMLHLADRLPEPQRGALGTAFGLSPGKKPPDRFLVGLAVLGLFAEVAREQPLVCVVDDAQWLDRASAQALAFVARRLRAESVALVFAARGAEEVAELTGLAELAVAGLPDDEARALLSTALRGPVDERVLDRIVAETRGNPLALLELTRGLTPAELAVGFGPAGATELPRRIEESFRERLAPLELGTRRLLLVAAAEPVGDPALVWRAAGRLGIPLQAAAPAAAAGLLEIGVRVRFRHPLVRSVVYRAASPQDRRDAHRVLAEATDREADPDRRTWHAAQATTGPDEDVADALERCAGRAGARGGLAAAAAFLERAAELTAHPERRAARTLAAAQATHRAGVPDAALRLLAIAEAGPLDRLQEARLELLRAEIAFTVNRGRQAPALLLKAALQLEPLDVRLARETHLEGLQAAMFAGALSDGGGVREAAVAARAAPTPERPPRAADLLLDGLAVRLTDGYAPGVPLLRKSLSAFRSPDLSADDGLRWLWLACTVATHLWDDESWEPLATRFHSLARDTGALTTLPAALNARILAHVFTGELPAAAALVEELRAATEATTARPFVPVGALLLNAWQGAGPEAFGLIEATRREALEQGEGEGLTVAGWAQALLCNGLRRYDEALAAAVQASKDAPVMGLPPGGALVELIEAAARTGEGRRAEDALQRLTETTRASGTDWAVGIEARSRALLSSGPAAESAYREAIDRLRRTRIRGGLARAHLLYGEWLRRGRRRLDAREQLRRAHALFAEMGMEGFAQRAAGELHATGEVARRRSVETSSELTRQEAQIVRLVREGLSNPEIGARLFLSPRTVEWHLSKIFSKLDITSRRQLRH